MIYGVGQVFDPSAVLGENVSNVGVGVLASILSRTVLLLWGHTLSRILVVVVVPEESTSVVVWRTVVDVVKDIATDDESPLILSSPSSLLALSPAVQSPPSSLQQK